MTLTTLSLVIISVWLVGLLLYWLNFRPKTELEDVLTSPVWICPNGHEVGFAPPPQFFCRKCSEQIHQIKISYRCVKDGKENHRENFELRIDEQIPSACPVCKGLFSHDGLKQAENDRKNRLNQYYAQQSFKMQSFSKQKLRKQLQRQKTLDEIKNHTRSHDISDNRKKNLRPDNVSEESDILSIADKFLRENKTKNLKWKYSNLILMLFTLIFTLFIIPPFLELGGTKSIRIQVNTAIDTFSQILPLFVFILLGIIIIFLSILNSNELNFGNSLKWLLSKLGFFAISIGTIFTSLAIILLQKKLDNLFNIFNGIVIISLNIIVMSLSSIIFSNLRLKNLQESLSPLTINNTFNNTFNDRIENFIQPGNVGGNINLRND